MAEPLLGAIEGDGAMLEVNTFDEAIIMGEVDGDKDAEGDGDSAIDVMRLSSIA